MKAERARMAKWHRLQNGRPKAIPWSDPHVSYDKQGLNRARLDSAATVAATDDSASG